MKLRINGEEMTGAEYQQFLEMKYPTVPETFISTVVMWVFHGAQPGSFTEAVLRNQFMEAIANADHVNTMHLPEIAKLVYNDVPMGARTTQFNKWPNTLKIAQNLNNE